MRSLQNATAQSLPSDIEQLLKAPICSPSTQQTVKEPTFEKSICSPSIQQTVKEPAVEPISISSTQRAKKQPIEEPKTQEYRPSYMGTAVRRNPRMNIRNQHNSASELSDQDSIGEESDEADPEEAVNLAPVYQPEAAANLSVNCDCGADSDDEMSSEVNEASAQLPSKLTPTSHQSTLDAKKQEAITMEASK